MLTEVAVGVAVTVMVFVGGGTEVVVVGAPHGVATARRESEDTIKREERENILFQVAERSYN